MMMTCRGYEDSYADMATMQTMLTVVPVYVSGSVVITVIVILSYPQPHPTAPKGERPKSPTPRHLEARNPQVLNSQDVGSTNVNHALSISEGSRV